MPESKHSEEKKTVSGMVLQEDRRPLQPEALVRALADNWGLPLDEWEGGKEEAVLVSGNLRLLLAYIPSPVFREEIRYAAERAWWWPEAEKEVGVHRSHFALMLQWPQATVLERYLAFTQVAGALLEVSDAKGFYLDQQSLLLPAAMFVEVARRKGEEQLPLELWIYFGLGEKDRGRFGFTDGLRIFGYPELEVNGSRRSLEEIHRFLYNVAHYLLAAGVELKEGESIFLENGEKVKVRYGESARAQGATLQLRF